MANQTGAASTDVDVIDAGNVLKEGTKGIACVIGPTERGVPGKVYEVGNFTEFEEKLGGFGDGSAEHRPIHDFVFECKRALDGKAPLRVSPLGHYTDPSDASTLGEGGLKATANVAAAAGFATATVEFVRGADGDKHVINLRNANGGLVFGFTGPAVVLADDLDAVGAALEALVNAQTGVTGVAAVYSTEDDVVGMLALTYDTGAFAHNGTLAEYQRTDGGATVHTTTTYTFAGGKPATLIVANGQAFGKGYNGVGIQVKESPSGNLDLVDLFIHPPVGGKGVVEEYRNLPRVYGENDIRGINFASYLAELVWSSANGLTGFPVTGDTIVRLAGGAFNVASLINDEDYIGDAEAATGKHAFDKVNDSVRITTLTRVSPDVDRDFDAYVAMRKDMRYLGRTPIGVNADLAIAYREGTGIYSHVPIDSFWSGLWTGGVKHKSPQTKQIEEFGGLGDILALKAQRDRTVGEHFAAAGPQKGRILDALDVVYNFGTPARKPAFDRIDERGINAIINDDTYGVMNFANSTLYKKSTTLANDNVADFMVHLIRTIRPLARFDQFIPNSPAMWKAMYQRIYPWLELWKDKGALVPTGDNRPPYIYLGDQDADTRGQATFNKQADLDAQRYRARILVSIVTVAKYIAIEVVNTDSSTDISIVSDPDQF